MPGLSRLVGENVTVFIKSVHGINAVDCPANGTVSEANAVFITVVVEAAGTSTGFIPWSIPWANIAYIVRRGKPNATVTD